MQFHLRTLLLLLALLPPAIAWIATPKVLWKVPIGDGRQMVFKGRRFGPSSLGGSGGFGWFEARRGDRRVKVDYSAGTVTEVGGRQVNLPESWQIIEVTLYGTDFGVVLDGKFWK